LFCVCLAWSGRGGVPGGLGGGGGEGSANSVEDREKGDLVAVSPKSGVLEAVVIW